MSKYNPCLAKNLSHIIDSVFIMLILALPFISYPFILNSNKIGKELYLVTMVSLWIVFKTVCVLKNKALKVYAVDIVMFLFYLYVLVHYFLFSFYTFLYDQFWVFTCYILLFYLFRWSYDKEQEKKVLFNNTIYVIWCFCLLQSIVALFQNFGFINSENSYFKTIGTFINPNFLGVYMVVGLLVLLYQILVFQERRRIVKAALLLSFFSMTYVLYLTESRASWISLIIGFLVLVFTSQNCIYFFKANKKKTIFLFALISIAVLGSLYLLYQLNKDSVHGRTLIRKIAALDIQKNPFFGNGIFNFDGVYNESKARYFIEEQRPWKEMKVADYVSNALNDYIQIIFEIGLLGFILIGTLLFIIIRRTELNLSTRFALAIVIAFVFLGLFTSILYNPTAMVFMVWALSILFVYGNNKIEIFVISNNRALSILKGISFFAFLTIGVLFGLKTKSLRDFKTVIEDTNQKFYYKLSDNDMFFIKDDAFVEFKLGFEKYTDQEISTGIGMMENSVKKSKIPEANIMLANIYTTQKDFIRTEQILLANVGIEPFRFEPRVNLLHFYIQTNQKVKSIKTAEEIINLPVKIKSNKIGIYKQEAEEYVIKNHLP